MGNMPALPRGFDEGRLSDCVNLNHNCESEAGALQGEEEVSSQNEAGEDTARSWNEDALISNKLCQGAAG